MDDFVEGSKSLEIFANCAATAVQHTYFLNLSHRGIDVENAIKLAAADDGFVTYDELRENLRK